MNSSCPRQHRLTRTGIFVILSVLVALLGAAAKRSQFDGPPHHGYLSKAVKMAGARVNPDTGTDIAGQIAIALSQIAPDLPEQPVHASVSATGFVFVSLLAPPLRV